MKLSPLHFVLFFTLLANGCKKAEPDNPNITHRTLSAELKLGTYNASGDMDIDINGDGANDFKIYLDLFHVSNTNFEYECDIAGDTSQNQILYENVPLEATPKVLPENTLISPGSVIWGAGASLFEYEAFPGIPETSYGAIGIGDYLIGIRFLIGTQLHYGWLKLNIAADCKSVLVKEAAYDVRPNVEILSGDK